MNEIRVTRFFYNVSAYEREHKRLKPMPKTGTILKKLDKGAVIARVGCHEVYLKSSEWRYINQKKGKAV